ncbi:probable receptor-like protein kinase At5g59700 [Rutidosis leptorrhynchoides]|uniref:probable receptor-like protein kinase At5g59700 n=1 Tax=Rutidosis leptorrhynchoides TaxID=125765 RepID=UPI003A99D53A
MESAITKLAQIRIPLQKILDVTNNFSGNNIIMKGDFGNVYIGKLDHEGKMIEIVARRLDRKYGHRDIEFWAEVSSLSRFMWIDEIVAMIGFCDEKGENIVINHHYPNGSLSRYIKDPLTLDVDQRFAITVAICRGISSIQTELEGDYIIHRNINSSTILLDDDWMPRLSGFDYSIKHSKERRNLVLNSEAIGTQGYIDPAIEKYGGVNYKSDIYSFGVVLFELLCGGNAFEENKLLASLAKYHYENGTMKDIIHPDLWNQMNPESFKCFSKAAYSCLQEDPTLRPDVDELWLQLEKADRLQVGGF